MALKVKTRAKGHIPGIPLRKLTDAEVEKYGGEAFLLASGLYEKDQPPKQTKTKEVNDGD